MKRRLLAAICALDAVIGDPPGLPHPVRVIGRFVGRGERFLRSRIREHDERAELAAGALLSAAVVAGAAAAAALAARLGGTAVEAALGAAALAARSLDDAVGDVQRALERRDMRQARRRLADIVGRDTADLEEPEVARAALEAAAESLCDGIIAPLLALRFGGVTAAWGFKAVSTLDSMIGHLEPPYTRFGRVAARLDDAANYVPARLSVVFIALSAAMWAEDAAGALALAVRDGRLHRSPNAGLCEAALAGALHRRLGGDNRYDGKLVCGPRFGREYPPPHWRDIARGRRLVALAAALAMLAAIGSLPE
jgi:adenosylcobinamide-phosphate synthase